MNNTTLSPLLISLLLTSSRLPASELRLPAIFADHMVLQQQTAAPVWGWAAPGQKVTVALAGRTVSAKANAEGRWQVKLTVPKANGKPLDLTVRAGSEHVSFTNVLAGEVWLCSGQSNMKHSLGATEGGPEAAAAADNPSIRLFQVDMWCAPQPLDDLRGQWQVSNPKSAAAFSAVAYYFGRDLHRALGVPVGLIDSTSGGTAAEAWISRPFLEADPRLAPLVKDDPAFFATVTQYEKDWAEYRQAQAEKRQPLPPYPKLPFRGWGYPAASFYNAMIAPLVPFAIKGVAWYQGEARTGRPFDYEAELTALIGDWRKHWQPNDLTFLIVQLPRITPVWNWPITREAQANVARTVPKVGLAVTVDLQDRDLHPRIKAPVGERLSLAALALAYDRKVEHRGPEFDRLQVEGGKVRLSFKHPGDGLVAAGGGALQGFSLSGEDRQFVPAQAVIDGETVLVSTDAVAAPVSVRYAFEDDPACNLFSRAGLPAAPFRTDAWPLEVKQ